MKKLWTKAALSAVALVCASAANAYVIDFESLNTSNLTFAPLVADGQYVTQGGYYVEGQEWSNVSSPYAGNGSLVGSLVNAADTTTCPDSGCPTGDTSNYYASLNNGVVAVGSLTGAYLSLSTFSAAFIAPAGVTLSSGQVSYLAVEADRADGSYAVGLFVLNGPSTTTGLTAFTTFSTASYTANGGTGTLTSGNITGLYFYSYYCTGTNCSAGTTDKGQFALDNITITAVPEPGEWLLMAAGLGVVGSLVRRRRSV